MCCLLKRETSGEEEWDEVKETVKESEIYLEQMLEKWGKNQAKQNKINYQDEQNMKKCRETKDTGGGKCL